MIGLILARKNSKGLPGKHLLPLAGKPLLHHVGEKAMSVLYHVYLSSDSEEILEAGKEIGLHPILRPSELAQDNTPAIHAIRHALNFIDDKDICLLNSCCPLMSKEDILEAIRTFKGKQADAVVSVIEDKMCHPSKVCITSDPNKPVQFGSGHNERQLLEKTYRRNAAIYVFKRSVAENYDTLWESPKTYISVMPMERSVDLNNGFDFHLCELLIKHPYRFIGKNYVVAVANPNFESNTRPGRSWRPPEAIEKLI